MYGNFFLGPVEILMIKLASPTQTRSASRATGEGKNNFACLIDKSRDGFTLTSTRLKDQLSSRFNPATMPLSANKRRKIDAPATPQCKFLRCAEP